MTATILVVEDSPASIKLATMLLEKDGYQVLQAENATDGLMLAQLHFPSVILMDIQLPDMDGLSAIRLLKKNQSTKHIKVVALTAFAMKGDERRMLDNGCDGYIAKPFLPATLSEEMYRLLGGNPDESF